MILPRTVWLQSVQAVLESAQRFWHPEGTDDVDGSALLIVRPTTSRALRIFISFLPPTAKSGEYFQTHFSSNRALLRCAQTPPRLGIASGKRQKPLVRSGKPCHKRAAEKRASATRTTKRRCGKAEKTWKAATKLVGVALAKQKMRASISHLMQACAEFVDTKNNAEQ